jgi:hypothetical protein
MFPGFHEKRSVACRLAHPALFGTPQTVACISSATPAPRPHHAHRPCCIVVGHCLGRGPVHGTSRPWWLTSAGGRASPTADMSAVQLNFHWQPFPSHHTHPTPSTLHPLVSCPDPPPSSAAPTCAAQNLVTFDGKAGTTFTWQETNGAWRAHACLSPRPRSCVLPPPMGGLSTGNFSVSSATNTAIFQGDVQIVPSLKAPGFCQSLTQVCGARSPPPLTSLTHWPMQGSPPTPPLA